MVVNILFVFVGGIVVLWILGEYLLVFVFVGFIVLFGIVVFNGVVLVLYFNMLFEFGMGMMEVVCDGVCDCLWFVLMMVCIIVLGMILLLLVSGLGLEI